MHIYDRRRRWPRVPKVRGLHGVGPHVDCCIYIYIYIYRERERAREIDR